MSVNLLRIQLESKRKQRADADKKVGEYRARESKKRGEAGKARVAAGKTKSESTASSKLREAERREGEALSAGKDADRWQIKAANYAREELVLTSKLQRAERTQADAAERARRRDQQKAQLAASADRASLESRILAAESMANQALRELPEAKAEKLRVLILGASSEGDLRVSREQKRIRLAVESARHRDYIELDVRPAATPSDLLDGITKFRPHVVHFSGHSDDRLIVFEDELDDPHQGVVVTASAFRKAIAATDNPPLLVLLNSCHSASQIDDLVAEVAPFAIGMSDTIADADAINYAAQFYAAITNGQSVRSSHLAGQAALELAGLEGAELPTLAWADDVDPGLAILVHPAT